MPYQSKALDWEKLRRMKADITPEKHEFKDGDYFRGIKTILTNEVAALKTAQALYKACVDANKKWHDPDFGP